jgi:hypothetical protein
LRRSGINVWVIPLYPYLSRYLDISICFRLGVLGANFCNQARPPPTLEMGGGAIAFSHLLGDSMMIWPSIIVFLQIFVSAIVLYSHGSSLDPDCSAPSPNLFFSSLDLLLIPVCLFIQMNVFRCYQSSMNYIDRLSQTLLAIVASFVSILLALILLSQSWSCSTLGLKLACCSTVCVSLYVAVVWIHSFWRNFIFTPDSQAKQSLLLLIRCWCLTTRFKKFLVVSPYLILFLFVMVQTLVHWSTDCALPFPHFGLISASAALLMGLAALVLLSYGRRRIHLNDSYEQLMDSIHESNYLNGQRRHHSTTASDVEALAKDSQRCISLTTLWYLAGGIHVFGLIWGTLGMYWSNYDNTCSHTLLQVLH